MKEAAIKNGFHERASGIVKWMRSKIFLGAGRWRCALGCACLKRKHTPSSGRQELGAVRISSLMQKKRSSESMYWKMSSGWNERGGGGNTHSKGEGIQYDRQLEETRLSGLLLVAPPGGAMCFVPRCILHDEKRTHRQKISLGKKIIIIIINSDSLRSKNI